jgi:trans-2,3-dihydro-3-hydroxyanthranilate isomerase
MRHLPYTLLDVFTGRALEGNQLAVFTDARELREEELQRIAKETNLSETTFIFPRDASVERERGVKVRIFTVAEELDFAGHPTLGTAAAIRGSSGAARIDLELRVGKIAVEFDDSQGPSFGTMRQRDPEFGQRHRIPDIAAFTSLCVQDLREDVPIETVSTGMAFAIVPVATLAALQSLRVDLAQASRYAEGTDTRLFFFVSTETVDPEADVHARMLFYNGEDPATGSASGCCAAWMVRHGLAESGQRIVIEQGLECRRPSRIFVSAEGHGDTVTNVRVGGAVVEVARGAFTLP